MPAKRGQFYRPVRWSNQRPCRNCQQLTSHWTKLCPWCRKMGRWGLFVGGLLGGLVYKVLGLWLG